MTKRTSVFTLLLVHALALLTALSSCGDEERRARKMPQSVQAYVYGYTSGTISRTAPIRVRFAGLAATEDQIGQEASSSLLRFEPSLGGKAVWEDAQTLRFEPEDPMPSATAFVATVALQEVFPTVPADARSFEFDFRTRDQFLELRVQGLHAPDPSDLSQQEIKGQVQTADYAEPAAVEAALSAKQGGQELPLRWQHDADGLEHQFFVEKVQRGEEASSVELAWNARELGLSLKESTTVEVPALGDFKVTDLQVEQGQEQFLRLHFSDPLLESQDFSGLVAISDYSGQLRFLADGNELRVYPAGRLSGERRISVNAGIKNVNGRGMQAPSRWTIDIQEAKPEVRLVGSGVILPNSDGLLFPFEAINLQAVEVEVFKIYHNNILQFLQTNSLDGSRNLYQVGRLTKRTRVELQQLKPGASTTEWTRYALQLDELIEEDPKAIYQIRIGFRPSYSTYFCGEESMIAQRPESETEQLYNGEPEELESFMDDWYGIEGRYPGFRWAHRQDPCYPAYYNSDRFVRRNVIASNIGLIAKSGAADECLVVVSDLRTAQPLSGATLEFYDYQQQLLATAESGSNGIAKAKLPREPFVVLAKKGAERGYLRLRDGDALSLSRFDVSGDVAQRGLKGFLYGERGVWRPGDSVFLNFILEDKTAQLPPNYPIRFELRGPRGQLQERRTTTENDHYVYPLHFATKRDAPTGIWQATVQAGGATFRKSLRIETVKPNRIKLELDFGKERLSAADEPLRPNLQANWLHGAPAGGLRAKVEAELSAADTQFEGFSGFEFDDPARRIRAAVRTVYEGRLDASGQAQLRFLLANQQQMPGRLDANFKLRVFEKGGDFSTSRRSLPYDPYESYAGIRLPENDYGSKRLEVGERSPIRFAAVNARGEKVANRKLNVGLYRIEWRWWWDQGQDEVSRYNTGTHYGAEQQTVVTTNAKGEAEWNLEVEEWGRYMVRVCDTETGHCSGDFFYAGYPWYGDDQEDYREAAAMLSFTSDKPAYQVGETVKIQLPDGKAGRMLLSIESGTEVVESYWVETEEGANTFSFEATPEMSPTAYVHLSMIQPHAQVDNDLPIRLYGVIPLKVEDPDTRLQPVADLPDELKPREPFTVEVSEQQGEPMTYTLAVVDEGLLGLTNYDTPNPWDHFYAREALGVRTWDVYDDVLGAYGGQLGRLLSIGGDAAVVPKRDQKANRFDPVAMHLGPFRLKKGAKARHQLEMPNYVGAVRVMVVAADEGAYGRAEKSVPVRQPLMVLGTLPRVLSPGEELQLPVNVFAMDAKVRNVQVSVEESSGLVNFERAQQPLRFSGTGDQLAAFGMKVKEATGTARFTITAAGGGERASQEIAIPVRNPNPYITEVDEQELPAGSSHQFSYQAIGMEGTNEVLLEISTLPPLDLGRRLQYLLRYPYGCLEQTLSGGFPQLYASKLLDLTEEQEQRTGRNIRATIDRLKRFQTGQGGLAYWPGQGNPNAWSSSFASHFLLEARALGYSIPPALLEQLLQYQKKRARLWEAEQAEAGFYGSNHALDQAYRLYTLALAKQPDLAAMNRLREYKDANIAAKWRLAAAYALAGKPEVARQITDNLSVEVSDYQEMSYTYGSGLRDRAMILEALVLMDEREEAAALVRDLSEALSSDRWLSTQETSFCLLAIGKYVGGSEMEKKLAFRYTENGQTANVGSNQPIMQIELGKASGSVQINNTSEQVLFARLIRSGQPVAGAETAAANRLQMEVRYLDEQGREISPDALPQGTDFVAEVRVTHPGGRLQPYRELALSQIFPSGWEIINSRMDGMSMPQTESGYTYRDIRDDRVHTFFDLKPGESRAYYLRLNAAYQGEFYLPATSCEAMYDHSVNARTQGKWVEVIRPRES